MTVNFPITLSSNITSRSGDDYIDMVKRTTQDGQFHLIIGSQSGSSATEGKFIHFSVVLNKSLHSTASHFKTCLLTL